MNPSPAFTCSPPRRSRRPALARFGVAAVSVGLLLATACSSADEGATPGTGPAAAPSTSAVTVTTTAPSPDPARLAMLDGILAEHRAAGEFVGARMALRDADGTVTETKVGTATADPDSPPVDLDVPWNVGSLTKTFVAVVVLQLAEEGRIDLDAGIRSYLPDLARADEITPRQLLQHTSGLGEYKNDPAVATAHGRVWTPPELIAVAERAGRVGEPGGAFHYSNTNYIVLGEIIERVTGHPWPEEVGTRVIEPLGLSHTSVITSERPIGYQVVNGTFVDTTTSSDISTAGAAGAVQSTNRDLLRFASALADGTLLSPRSTSAMRTFVPGEDYSAFGVRHGSGLGIEEYATDDLTVIGHMGTGDAQSAFFGFDPVHHTAVAVSTNTAVAGPQAIMAIEALTAAR